LVVTAETPEDSSLPALDSPLGVSAALEDSLLEDFAALEDSLRGDFAELADLVALEPDTCVAVAAVLERAGSWPVASCT
jgi:hypothetical protein